MTICTRCQDYIPNFEVETCGNGDCPHRPIRVEADDDLSDEDPDKCTNAGGHEWAYTGTAYGGDDPRWMGEGRSYCVHCGTDGDA